MYMLQRDECVKNLHQLEIKQVYNIYVEKNL